MTRPIDEERRGAIDSAVDATAEIRANPCIRPLQALAEVMFETGPRSGRTSRTTGEDKADTFAAGARSRTAGDTSNATAGENFAAGGLKVFEPAPWAADAGYTPAELAIIKSVAAKTKPFLIRICIFLHNEGG
jgi:hypothetical protein